MTIDATPYISIVRRPVGRPRFGRGLRVDLGGAKVAATTRKQIQDWMRVSKQSRGVLLDQLVEFGAIQFFSPSAKLPKP